MEVYLNSIEMGNGIYGAQATAKNKVRNNSRQADPGAMRAHRRHPTQPDTI